MLPVIQPRACGPCTACCTVYAIDDVGVHKEAHEPCRHIRATDGCGIYTVRPPTCREFVCLWLKGLGAESDRPDVAGYVMRELEHPLGGPLVAFTEYAAGSLADGTPGAAASKEVGFQVPVLVMRRDGTSRAIVPVAPGLSHSEDAG
jgi:hypothetical protein